MASAQINLLLFAGVLVLLYVSVTPVEAHQCGYHYHTNDNYTMYNSTYYKRYYAIYYGYCYNRIWTYDGPVYNYSGERLYDIIRYYNGNEVKCTGDLQLQKKWTPSVEQQTETQGYLKMTIQKELSNIAEDRKEAEESIEQA